MKNQWITLILLALIGCGPAKVEGDKHKDIPFLPESTNDKFTVKQFSHSSYNYLGIVDGYLYTACEITSEKKSELNGAYIVVYDKDFNEVKRILSHEASAIDQSGAIYIQHKSVWTKYSRPHFKPQIIEKLPISYTTVRDENQAFIDEQLKQQRDFNVEAYVGKLLTQKVIDFQNQHTACYSIWQNDLLLKSARKEYWVEGRGINVNTLSSNCPAFHEEINYANDQEAYENRKNVKLVRSDKAVTGNTSHGNHLSFGYTQYGIEYFDLTLAGNTTSFKFNSKDLDQASLLEYPSFNEKEVILIGKTYSELFVVRLK